MLKRTLVVFVMLAMAAFVFAADVALVTWVEGEVTASIQDDTTDEVHEWLVEAAEMLPVDVEIMVQEDSSLKFVHFHNNVEYDFGADSWLQIIKDDVLSEQEFASSALQMVSAKFELDKSMRQQVGAVIADAQPRTITQTEFKPQASASDMSIADYLFEEEVARAPLTEPTLEAAPPEELVSVMLALPVEIAQLLASDISTLKVADHEAEVNTDVDGWVVIQLSLAPSQQLSQITLNGDGNFLHTKVLAVEIPQDSMAQAWSFEKHNLLPQAAALWVEQASSGVELAEVHLDRIRALMLGE